MKANEETSALQNLIEQFKISYQIIIQEIKLTFNCAHIVLYLLIIRCVVLICLALVTLSAVSIYFYQIFHNIWITLSLTFLFTLLSYMTTSILITYFIRNMGFHSTREALSGVKK